MIHTGGKPVLLKVKIYAPSPCVVHMIGVDTSRKNSTYFNRTNGSKDQPFSGLREFYFPMPISPGDLRFIVKPTNPDCHVEIRDVKQAKLNQGDLWLRPDERSFLDFAIQFATKAGSMPQGVYESDDGKFFISYMNDIVNYETKKSENTPARISRATGYIEINRSKFMTYTIPMRLVMLLHEFMHWRLKSRNELECDFNALNIFLKLGSSKTQALTAFTKVFHNTDPLIDRTAKIKKFIEKYPDYNPER